MFARWLTLAMLLLGAGGCAGPETPTPHLRLGSSGEIRPAKQAVAGTQPAGINPYASLDRLRLAKAQWPAQSAVQLATMRPTFFDDQGRPRRDVTALDPRTTGALSPRRATPHLPDPEQMPVELQGICRGC